MNNVVYNPRRGCGHLVKGGLYLVGEMSMMGGLQPWVSYVWPLKWGRSFASGVTFGSFELHEAACHVDTDPPNDRIARLNRYDSPKFYKPSCDRLLSVALDMLMWCGIDNYPDAKSFIDEARERGISKRIPFAVPPRIVRGLTRLFIVHPDVDGNGPYVIGYGYITGVNYVVGGDAERDEAAKEWAAQGLCREVVAGPPDLAGPGVLLSDGGETP